MKTDKKSHAFTYREAGARLTIAIFRYKTSGVFLKKWWSYAGSNRRPPACKAGALPAEL